jgi:hypothetical protein
LTFRFRVVPLGCASTYSRPVLGARGNVEGIGPRRKGLRTRNLAQFAGPLCLVVQVSVPEGAREPPLKTVVALDAVFGVPESDEVVTLVVREPRGERRADPRIEHVWVLARRSERCG